MRNEVDRRLDRRIVEINSGRSDLIAVADSVLVMYDYQDERPIAVSDELVRAIEAFEGHALRG